MNNFQPANEYRGNSNGSDARVAVLVDCDNVSPEILPYALRVVAQFGRVAVRRGYGNHTTLANKWQEALVRLAFTPCLQYQYKSGKNTADIALALDAMEMMFDQRADTFCLVTSDSDFAYLCRKLRERGATVCIVGESKTPEALRNASDQFFEWAPTEAGHEVSAETAEKISAKESVTLKAGTPKQDAEGTDQVSATFCRRGCFSSGQRHLRRKSWFGSVGPVSKANRPCFFAPSLRALRPLRHAADL